MEQVRFRVHKAIIRGEQLTEKACHVKAIMLTALCVRRLHSNNGGVTAWKKVRETRQEML